MTIKINIPGADNYVLQEAISMYSDEAYTNAKKLNATAIVGSNPQIDVKTETFTGQIRWWKPLNPKINIASITDPSRGQTTSTAQDYLKYIKSVRTHGAEQVNMQEVVTQQDGLAKIGRDFSETRAQDEHNAILANLKGVAIAEVLNGACAGSGAAGLGGQTWNNDPQDKRYGFYIDLGSSKPIIEASTVKQGAARAEGFLNAIGQAWKDYEPDYAYLVVSPEVYASLRSANLVDQTTVTEGKIVFSTIFNGKFRLIQTRANQSLSAAELAKINSGPGINVIGTKMSFVVLPGSIAFSPLQVPMPVEIDRTASSYKGGGMSEIWYRWGYVYAPAGYDWAGKDTEFVSDVDYMSVTEGNDQKELASIGTIANVRGVWNRKFQSALSLGILPILHS